MKPALRGPLLLTMVGVLSFISVLAYLVRDVKDDAERQGAVIRGEKAIRSQGEQSMQDRAELASQYNTIIESLRQIQEAVESCSR